MSTSRRPRATFARQAVDLAWGAWVELGVPGADRSHDDWAIDPEPLILFTAFLGHTDGRLRDEATDWCIRSWRSVSKNRLRRLLADAPDEVRASFAVFAATVNAHAGTTWPTDAESRPHRTSGRPVPPMDMLRPSMSWLRLRAIFGVSTRAEILRFFLSHENAVGSAATIANLARYTKRSIAEEAEVLAQAGILMVRKERRGYEYKLARPQALADLVQSLPAIRPDWAAVCDIARELVLLERSIEDEAALPESRPVKVRLAIEAMEAAQYRLDLPEPARGLRGDDLWPAVRSFGNETLGEWSVGRWHGFRFA